MLTHTQSARRDATQSPSPSQSKSGRESDLAALHAALTKALEPACHRPEDRPLADEITMIVAEMLALPPETRVRIGGQQLPAGFVAEVYRRLRHAHTVHVIENFKKANYPVKYLKTYLRTALYNAVFEAAFRVCNDVRTDMAAHGPT